MPIASEIVEALYGFAGHPAIMHRGRWDHKDRRRPRAAPPPLLPHGGAARSMTASRDQTGA